MSQSFNLQILSVISLDTLFVGGRPPESVLLATMPHSLHRLAGESMKKTLHLGGRSVILYFKLRCRYFLSKSKHNFSIQISHSTYKHGCINTSYASCMKIFLQGLKYIVLSTDGPINDQKPLNTSLTNRGLISCWIQSFLSPVSSKITGNSCFLLL